jgi:DNA-directed RNA polymerase subunit beta
MARRHSFARTAEIMPMPNLNSVQRDSFDWFLKEGLKELFAEMSPMHDVADRDSDQGRTSSPRPRRCE